MKTICRNHILPATLFLATISLFALAQRNAPGTAIIGSTPIVTPRTDSIPSPAGIESLSSAASTIGGE